MHLISPIGFTLDSKMIKRSGMDYFNKVDLMEWESLEAFLYKNPINEKHYFFRTCLSIFQIAVLQFIVKVTTVLR